MVGQQIDKINLKAKKSILENDSLDIADAAISERDTLIQDLTTRLEEALTTLDQEREQYKLRRQVIFPKD